MKKNVAVVGTGYVGLVTGACLAEIGHSVVCIDNDKKKIASLKKGGIPIYEPGLEEVVKKNRRAGRLSFAGSIAEGMKDAELVFIAVGTPPTPDGDADLSFVEAVAREVARHLTRYTVVVDKSTVPVHTGEKVQETMRLHGKPGAQFDVASNPEFLREGTAVKDFLHPDRIVIGVDSPRAEKALRELYAPLQPAPLIVTDIKSAELIKHSSNSFLALKISFINAVSRICESVGADVSLVAEGMGHDARIGKSFLKAGLGFGGSCFPKDLSAYIKMAEEAGYHFDLLKSVQKINADQRQWVARKLKKALWNLRGKTVAIWGLAFKPDTDDLRNAPALDIAAQLMGEGCKVRVHDPVAMDKAKPHLSGVYYAKDAYDAAKGADAVILVTEWKEYKDVDLKKVRASLHTPVFLDGRNVFDPKAMAALGFQYHSVGRPSA